MLSLTILFNLAIQTSYRIFVHPILVNYKEIVIGVHDTVSGEVWPHFPGGRRRLCLCGGEAEVTTGRTGRIPGVKIERAVGCGAAAYSHCPGGFLSGLSLRARSIWSSSWTRVNIALGVLSLAIYVITTLWKISTSLMMVDISRVLSWFSN